MKKKTQKRPAKKKKPAGALIKAKRDAKLDKNGDRRKFTYVQNHNCLANCQLN